MEVCYKIVKIWRLEKICFLLEIYSRIYKGYRVLIYRYYIKVLIFIKKVGENLLSLFDFFI